MQDASRNAGMGWARSAYLSTINGGCNAIGKRWSLGLIGNGMGSSRLRYADGGSMWLLIDTASIG